MSQYLLSVHNTEESLQKWTPEEQQNAFEQVSKFNQEVQDAGAWVFAGGLQGAEIATVVRTEGGKTTMTDGPFPEAKEQLGGFWVIDVADLDAALEWAAKGSAACEGPVEVRPFQEEPAD